MFRSPLTSWKSQAARSPSDSALPRSRCPPTNRRSAGSQAPSCLRGPGMKRRRTEKHRTEKRWQGWRGAERGRPTAGWPVLTAPRPAQREPHRALQAAAAAHEYTLPPSAASPPYSASCWRRRAARAVAAPGSPSLPASHDCARARCGVPRRPSCRWPRLRQIAAVGCSVAVPGTPVSAQQRRLRRLQARRARTGAARCRPSCLHPARGSLLGVSVHHRKSAREEPSAVGSGRSPLHGS